MIVGAATVLSVSRLLHGQVNNRCTKVAAPRLAGYQHPGTLVDVTNLHDTTAAAICLAEYFVEAKNYFWRRKS